LEAQVWKQHLQIKDAVPVPPYSYVGAPAGTNFRGTSGDALTHERRCSNT
jgi:hypothetical protein